MSVAATMAIESQLADSGDLEWCHLTLDIDDETLVRINTVDAFELRAGG